MGTKLYFGYFDFNSVVKLMVEMILYKKYKGPLNKFNWWPVVIVNVFESAKASIFCLVKTEVSTFKYCFCKAETKMALL